MGFAVAGVARNSFLTEATLAASSGGTVGASPPSSSAAPAIAIAWSPDVERCADKYSSAPRRMRRFGSTVGARVNRVVELLHVRADRLHRRERRHAVLLTAREKGGVAREKRLGPLPLVVVAVRHDVEAKTLFRVVLDPVAPGEVEARVFRR